MSHRILVSCAWICCSLIFASFALFALDQISGASQQQVAEIAGGSPTRAGTPVVQRQHGQPRHFIDGAAKVLTYPFHSLVSSSSQWANHLVVLVLGVLVYGLGLGYLSRYATALP